LCQLLEQTKSEDLHILYTRVCRCVTRKLGRCWATSISCYLCSCMCTGGDGKRFAENHEACHPSKWPSLEECTQDTLAQCPSIGPTSTKAPEATTTSFRACVICSCPCTLTHQICHMNNHPTTAECKTQCSNKCAVRGSKCARRWRARVA